MDYHKASPLPPAPWLLACCFFRRLFSAFLNASPCAGSLILDVSLQALFSKNCVSEVDAVISGVQNYQVAALVLAFRQPGKHFGTLGAPWETMGAADRTASWNVIFKDSGWISDLMLGVSEQSSVF